MMAATPEPAAAGPEAPAGGGEARFLEPQPIREEQVENAVNFLSHPKVKGSPVVYRRSFLEKKGLSREEIDEAFRRVPDPPTDSSPNSVPTSGPTSGALNSHARQPIAVQQTARKPRSWGKMLIALGFLTAAGVGAGAATRRYFVPRFKEWILELVSGKSKASAMEEATTAAAAAATQIARAMQDLAKAKAEESDRMDKIIRAVEAQTVELKNTLAGVRDAVQIAEMRMYPRGNDSHSNGFASTESMKGQTNSSEVRVVNERSNIVSNSQSGAPQVKASSPLPSNGQMHAPQSQSYLDVVAMLERGEKPPGIREVNDKPPNPNQAPSNSRLQPRPKPWEKPTVEAWPINAGVSGESGQSGRGSGGGGTEVTSSSGTGNYSEQWWRKRGDTDATFSSTSSSVKITEVDTVSEVDTSSVKFGPPLFGPSSRPTAGWVPPPVPQPVYPGAEEAIRRPKAAAGSSAPISSSQSEGVNGSTIVSSSQSTITKTQVVTEVLDDSMQFGPLRSAQIEEIQSEQEAEHLDGSSKDATGTSEDVEEEERVQ